MKKVYLASSLALVVALSITSCKKKDEVAALPVVVSKTEATTTINTSADKMYDDPELHWIVLLVNDITDRYHQWPMNFSQFNQFIADKYDDVDGTHHYELAQSSGSSTTKIEVYNNSALYSGDNDYYGTSTAITNREYEEAQQDIKRKIRLLDPRYVQQFTEEYETLMKESII